MGVIRSFEEYYGNRILATMAQRGDYRPLLKAHSIEEARRLAIKEKQGKGQLIGVSDNVVKFPLA